MAASRLLLCPERTPSAGYIYIAGWPIRARPIRAQGGIQGPMEAHKNPGKPKRAKGSPQWPRGPTRTLGDPTRAQEAHKGPGGPQGPRKPTRAQGAHKSLAR